MPPVTDTLQLVLASVTHKLIKAGARAAAAYMGDSFWANKGICSTCRTSGN